ncbi:permease-like cell division protein FtsX [Actinoplanes sp. DH11]|uniref:permease-like cell division protein FtsX n=1 Tax=Actinoplanes sp. DH11 TaxID=2857011 RepID=UPI001E2848D1|nr:permease-like cell division protein FtsX [Actinoplanes sp. DH11]
MPDHLKDLFDRVLDDEPVPPDGDLAGQAMAQGRGIRRRRGLIVGGSVASAIVAVVVALNLTPAPAGPPPQVSAAAARLAQAEPQCTWPVPDDATDVSIFLRQDVTERQRTGLRDALDGDPLVRNLVFETRQEAYEKFKVLWRDSPDLVAAVDASQLPESFRLELTTPAQYPAFAARFAGRAGVEDLIGGMCP